MPKMRRKFSFFQGQVINYVERTDDFIYAEPIYTALLMPVPRTLFPEKPDGKYLKTIQTATLGSDLSGAAFLNYAEAYYAFGWLGIVIDGLLIGFLSKVFFMNFVRSRSYFMPILALGIYNGVLYVIISRGYLAQQFLAYMYFIIIPIWIAKGLKMLKA